jgi:hypothetical protein
LPSLGVPMPGAAMTPTLLAVTAHPYGWAAIAGSRGWSGCPQYPTITALTKGRTFPPRVVKALVLPLAQPPHGAGLIIGSVGYAQATASMEGEECIVCAHPMGRQVSQAEARVQMDVSRTL